MATYHLPDVMDHIMGIINDGIFFADLTEMPGDDESPTYLSFSAPDPDDKFCEIDYESVDSVTDDGPFSISEKVCYGLTPEELSTVHHALTNALEYFKECSADSKSYDRKTLDEIKASSVKCRNLQAKIGKFLDDLV